MHPVTADARRVGSSRGRTRGRRLPGTGRTGASVLTLLAGLCAVGAASGLGLDEIAQQSTLGEPLRIVIPVLLSGDDAPLSGDLLGECFKLANAAGDRSDPDVPRVSGGRLSLERSAQGARLVVTTNRPINDPVVSITIEVGCAASIRRQYTLLLDPPAIEPPIAEAAREGANAPREGAGPRRASTGSPGALPRATAAGSAISPRRAPPRPKSDRPQAQRRAAAIRAASAGVAAKPPSPAPTPNPQLSVSRGLDDAEHGRTASGPITAGGSAQPSIADVEVETVVLQRRVAELSEMVQRMQQDLRTAQAARDAAEVAAKRARSAALERSSTGNAPLFAALIALVCLLAVALWSRGHRFRGSTLGSVAVLDADTMGPTVTPEAEIVDTRRGAAPTKKPGASPSPATGSPLGDDPELAFDDDLAKHVERYAAFSALEREYPRFVSQLARTWGRPEVIGNLRDILVYPRAGTKRLSREAVSELMLLQAIAMESLGLAFDVSGRS